MSRHRGHLNVAKAVLLAIGGCLLAASFSQPAAAQLGDYNSDGRVDAADFTIWGDTLGSSFDLRADGDTNGVVDATDHAIWNSVYAVPTFSNPAATGGPQLTITNLGPNGSGNLVWSVGVSPNSALFTNPDDAPDRGIGGTVATEVAFEVVGSSLVSAVKNALNFPFDNRGDSPFAFGDPPSSGVTTAGNRVFAALGSDFFTTASSKEMLRIESLGSATTTIVWSGVYGLNGDQGLLAQNSGTYQTSGSLSVPEPAMVALFAVGVLIFAGARSRQKRGFRQLISGRVGSDLGHRLAVLNGLCLLATLVPCRFSYSQYLNLSNTASSGKLNIRSNEFGHFGDFPSFGTYYQSATGPAAFMYLSTVLLQPESSNFTSVVGGPKTSDTGVQNGARHTTFTMNPRGGPTLLVELSQAVAINTPVLTQTYTFQNGMSSPIVFRLIQYQDADLLPNGAQWLNKATATAAGDLMTSDPAGTAVAMSATSDSGTFEGYGVYRAVPGAGVGHDLYRLLEARGELEPDEYNAFHSGVSPIAHLTPNDDANHDFMSDGIGDVSVASQWRFELLPGAKATLTVTTSIVPEPTTLFIAQLGAIAYGLRIRRQRNPINVRTT